MKKKRSSLRRLCFAGVAMCVVGLGTTDCGKKNNNNNGGGPMNGPGDQSIKPTADMQGAFGLLIMDSQQGAH